MLESDMRQIVVRALKPLDAMSVENPARPGTPDVNYIEGWVELKILEEWPKKPGTPVRVPCFTQQQRVWLKRRLSLGGKAFFLIRVADDLLLFYGDTACDRVGSLNRAEMIDLSLYHSVKTLNQKELIRCLRRRGSRNSKQNT